MFKFMKKNFMEWEDYRTRIEVIECLYWREWNLKTIEQELKSLNALTGGKSKQIFR